MKILKRLSIKLNHIQKEHKMELDSFETWRIAQSLGRKGLYIITNDVNIYILVKESELKSYDIKIEEWKELDKED